MNGCKITCYADVDECQYRTENGWCGMYDRMCEEIHINEVREDGGE